MTKNLEQDLRKARENYYRDGSSNLSDAEYDQMEDELRAIDPDNQLLKEIGADTDSGWPKFNHKIPMGSLNKVQNEEQYNHWLSSVGLITNKPYVFPLLVTEKLDGISIAVQYKSGKFMTAVTRGDGTIGEDISTNVIKMKNVPDSLPNKFTGWLRGEILLYKNDWKRHMSKKKNPRNAAAGTAKRHDGEGCEYLTVLFYGIQHSDTTFASRHEELNYIIHELGLKTPNIIGPVHVEEVPKIVTSWNANRDNLLYEIDGMVIDINAITIAKNLGEVDGRPKGAIAYKFPPIQKETTVVDVTWQIGRTGRLTPVAELEPVDIGGVTISRASLHTARMALNLQAGKGSRVLISRRNDVIPYVEKVLSPPTSPVVEPTNYGEIEWDGEYLRIKQLDDKTELYNAVKTWVERLRILHWGHAFIKLLIDYDMIKSLPDIYKLDWNLVSNFAGAGIAKRAKESLESKGQNIPFADFISALNIRYLDTKAKNLVSIGIDSPEKLLKSNIVEIESAEGIGKTKALEIRKSIEHLRPIIAELATIIKFKEKSGALVGLSFCFTGAMSRPRKELENMALDAGAEIKKSVSAGLTHLVMADPESTTTKAKKARELGTQCINEETFKEMCNE